MVVPIATSGAGGSEGRRERMCAFGDDWLGNAYYEDSVSVGIGLGLSRTYNVWIVL